MVKGGEDGRRKGREERGREERGSGRRENKRVSHEGKGGLTSSFEKRIRQEKKVKTKREFLECLIVDSILAVQSKLSDWLKPRLIKDRPLGNWKLSLFFKSGILVPLFSIFSIKER